MPYAWDADVGWGGAVGKFHTCSTSPDTPDFAATSQWERSLARHTHNSSIFGTTSNLYVTDRCFVPRRICKLRLRSLEGVPRGAQLLLPRDGPAQTHLLPGKFDVVLGAAQVVGVLARSSFASQLERRGGVPVVNLGRGAAGPHIYTDPGSWPLLAPLLTRARAVIICVMAGRSSPNTESGAFSGQSFGSEQLRAYDRVNALEKRGNVKHATRLRDESLASARRDYTELVQRIRSGGGGGSSPPRVLLAWFSGCPASGCAHIWDYPQYYTRASHLTELRTAMGDGVEMVDLSYGHLRPSPALPIDQCTSCAAPGKAVCNSPVARQDGTRTGSLCGRYCGSVIDAYYPDDAAHAYAARVLLRALREAPSSRRAGNGGRGVARALPSPSPPPTLDPLPPPRTLALGAKLFYHHIHKAAGTVFLAYLAGLEGVYDCAAVGVTNGDHTAPTSWPLLARWWYDERPQCTLASIETPELGDMHAKLATSSAAVQRWQAQQRQQRQQPIAARGSSSLPQMLSYLRHPIARCRSHWRYEQSLCRRRPLGMHAQYCNKYFLPRYGGAAINDSRTHVAFAEQYCTEHVSRSLSPANGIASAVRFFVDQFAFVGISELFAPSLCLFLHQARRFRRDLCTCSPGEPTLLIERELPPQNAYEEAMLRQGAVGVPPLMLNDADLRRRNPQDIAVYEAMLAALKHRVRALERQLNASILDCGSRHR